MDRLKRIVEESAVRLVSELAGSFFPIPRSACKCGKPIVFIQPDNKFKCTRCDREYELVVEVRQTGGER